MKTPPQFKGMFERATPVMDMDDDAPPVAPPTLPPATPKPTPQVSQSTAPEAERYLISCALLDAATVIPACEVARITPHSFTDSHHIAIYSALLAIWRTGVTPDIASVAAELREAKALASVGGWAGLLALSESVPTAINAASLIESVRQDSLRRDLISAVLSTAEKAKDSSDIDDLLATAQDRLKSIASGTSQSRAEQIAARAYDPKRIIAKPPAIFTLDGTTVSTPGNLTAIYSQAKTGKSSLIGAMIAATMTNPASGHDTLGVVGPNYAKHALLHFDTEQSPYDWQQLITSSLRRVNEPTPPPWLMSYTLTGMGADECRTFIEASVKRAKKLHGGIHSIIIDGIADLVTDPNDAEDCFPLITRLHALAIEYSTAVISILHMNPGAEATKGRGHLGSQLERKAESNLTIEKDGNEVSRVYGLKQRGKAITKDKAHCFKWSDEKQMHVTTTKPDGADSSPKSSNGGRPAKYEFSEFRHAIPAKTATPLRLGELHRAIRLSVPITDKSLYNVLQRFADEGLLEVSQLNGAKAYRMAL